VFLVDVTDEEFAAMILAQGEASTYRRSWTQLQAPVIEHEPGAQLLKKHGSDDGSVDQASNETDH
jgi:hypothetical protein